MAVKQCRTPIFTSPFDYTRDKKVRYINAVKLICLLEFFRDYFDKNQAVRENLSSMQKSYFIYTYGCQMNKNDSEIVSSILEGLGYTPAESYKDADLILLNTCSVREKAELKAYGRLGELKYFKETSKPDLIIGIIGCMPQYQKEEVFKKAPYVDFVIGTLNVYHLPQILERIKQGERQVIEILDNRGQRSEVRSFVSRVPGHVPRATSHELLDKYDNWTNPKRQSKYQAWISIMYGCDNFCSYCIVPYTRGREISRPKEEIFDEIKNLNNNIYKDIVLLGQNVNSYGKNLYKDYDFSNLLIDICKVENIENIEFLTSHPKDMSDKLIETISKNKKIKQSIHLPLQSGDNYILKMMNRGYTYEDYKNLYNKIIKIMPDAEISTDLIAGFPGETDEMFQNTINAVKELKFSRVNTAAFSPRPKTKAENMPNQLPKPVRYKRLQELMKTTDHFQESCLLLEQ